MKEEIKRKWFVCGKGGCDVVYTTIRKRGKKRTFVLENGIEQIIPYRILDDQTK